MDGLLTEVVISTNGSAATAAVAIGGTSVPVENLTEFADEGGKVDIAGVVYDYTGVDATTVDADGIGGAIILPSPGLTVAVAEFDPVLLLVGGEPAVDYFAEVDLIDDEDGEPVLVPLETREERLAWPVRVYDPPLPVTLAPDLSTILRAPGVVPILDGASIDASTLDVTALPPVSDGNAPSAATTVTPIGGIGSMFYRWTEVDNADPVTYRLYVRAGSSPAAPTLLWTNLATQPSFEASVSQWAVVSGSNAPAQSTTHVYGTHTKSMLVARGSGISTLWASNDLSTKTSVSTTYTVSARIWVPASNPSNGTLRVAGSSVVGTPVDVSTSLRDQWARVSVTFTRSASGTIFFYINGGTSGQIWVDTVTIYQGTDPGPEFDGDTPDTADIAYAWTGTPYASTSTMSSITLNTAYEVAAGVGLTSASVRKLADGTAIVSDGSVTYHAIVAVEDADGPGPASTDVTGIPAQVNTADINVNAITAGMLTANDVLADAINASDLTAVTITGALVRTAATGPRWELLTADGNVLAGYSSDANEIEPARVVSRNPTTGFRPGPSALQMVAPRVTGDSSTGSDQATLTLLATPLSGINTGRSSAVLGADFIQLASAEVLIAGPVDATMRDGDVGTGTFRTSVDARANAMSAARMQAGIKNSGTLVAGVQTTLTVTFPTAFSSAPKVVVCPVSSDAAVVKGAHVVPGSETTTQFQISFFRATGTTAFDANWIAVKP